MTTTELTIEPGVPFVTATRIFDAPTALVFKAMTDPELIPRWWGPAKYAVVIDKMEARAGGEWRFLTSDDAGNQYNFHGVYHQVSPTRVVQTFEFEGVPGHCALETMTLEDLGDGRTKMTAHSIYESVEDRDGMVSSGMEGGLRESHERLTELLAKLAA
ncbi:MAG: hypothetical protein QOE92_1666 [Chloroflexota bacterium]|jgi:uncharacterized protein YndB with AHSA1/START domain|nr:hypothetical protein [Chloroflexota bacterium]